MKWFSRILYCFDHKNRAYVSEADLFLQAFDAAHPERSPSQIKEVSKHHNIFNRPKKGRINWS